MPAIAPENRITQSDTELHVGLAVPRHTGKQIHNWVKEQQWPEGTELEHPDEYHVTLLYTPEGHDEHKDAWWMEHLEHARDVTFDKFESFPRSPEGMHPYVLRLDSPEIEDHANMLQGRAEAMGLPITHFPGGYKPHLTVGYGPQEVTGLAVPDFQLDLGPSSVSPVRAPKDNSAKIGPNDAQEASPTTNPTSTEASKAFGVSSHRQALAEGPASDAEAQVNDPYFPTLEDATEANQASLQGWGQTNHALLRPEVLQGALSRPQQYYHYTGSIPQAAAALAHGVGQSQAFEDGNKRTAYWLTHHFLHENGHGHIAPSDDEELADHIIGYANGTHRLEDTAQMYEDRLHRQAFTVTPWDPDADYRSATLAEIIGHTKGEVIQLTSALRQAGYPTDEITLVAALQTYLLEYESSEENLLDPSGDLSQRLSAFTEQWEPGFSGKGMLSPMGSPIMWKTDAPYDPVVGYPHHTDVMTRMGWPAESEIQNAFYIHPDGRVEDVNNDMQAKADFSRIHPALHPVGNPDPGEDPYRWGHIRAFKQPPEQDAPEEDGRDSTVPTQVNNPEDAWPEHGDSPPDKKHDIQFSNDWTSQ